MVEFESGYVVGFFEMAGMEMELSKLLQRKVDLRTPAELSRYFRQIAHHGALNYPEQSFQAMRRVLKNI